MKRIVLGAVWMLAVTGCSTLGSHEPPSGPWTRPLFADDTESLLVYYEWVHRLPAARFARECDTARQIFDRTASDFDRLRYAITLSVPDTATRDLPRALELVDPVAKNTASPLYPMAFFLQSQFNEQRRLEASAVELRQKLDALKSLEKDMSQHGVGAK